VAEPFVQTQRTAGGPSAHKAYDALRAARSAFGVSRLVMGVHMADLADSGAWRGRSGAKSYRRFLLEEGIDPKAAAQYMAVARAFLIDHDVDPYSIALVGMRVLVDAIQYLRAGDPSNGVPSNVADIVSIVTSMPSAEAHAALRDRFDQAKPAESPTGVSSPVRRILTALDDLTLEERGQLYGRMRMNPPTHAAAPARSHY